MNDCRIFKLINSWCVLLKASNKEDPVLKTSGKLRINPLPSCKLLRCGSEAVCVCVCVSSKTRFSNVFPQRQSETNPYFWCVIHQLKLRAHSPQIPLFLPFFTPVQFPSAFLHFFFPFLFTFTEVHLNPPLISQVSSSRNKVLRLFSRLGTG